jgi:hypothetical protein
MRLIEVSVLGSLAYASSGCLDFLTPQRTGLEQCADISALYCNSYSVPQTLNDKAAGTCCVVGTNGNAAVGYLCAYGANYQAAGCFDTLELARDVCPSAVAIVRCTR